jgi:hypothetical protein
VTVPADFCFHCHEDVAQTRPSHRNFSFTSCTTAGCHNFHDNSALYENFLTKHLHEPDVLTHPLFPRRDLFGRAPKLSGVSGRPLFARDQDAPVELSLPEEVIAEWESTAHARVGINCTGCHKGKDAATSPSYWESKANEAVCLACHAEEGQGFVAGKHGMRLAQNLSPMKPLLARQAMRPEARDKELNCVSCHGAHTFDTRHAGVAACLSCHNDSHSLAYKSSPHFGLWQAELAGQGVEGSGVSCATCHLPRDARAREGLQEVHVQHNQNANLRPNTKMIRSVCLNCHGLGFTLDALADAELVRRNFQGRPSSHVESLNLAELRLRNGKNQGD